MYVTTKKFILIFTISVFLSVLTFAHPGRTDSNGCHTCRTNCEKWEIPYGFYHRHNPVRSCFEDDDNEITTKTELKIEPIPTTPIPLENKPVVPVLPKQNPGVIVLPKSPSINNSHQSILVNSSKPLYKVTSVTDGDTIKVDINGKVESVRLLSIDTPETYKKKQCFGSEATSMMIGLVKDKSVKLEKDSIQSDRDRFGRLLRYVYLENGVMINEEMVKNGYAYAYTKLNSDKLKDFVILEKKAKSEKLGLWGSCNIFSRLYSYMVRDSE